MTEAPPAVTSEQWQDRAQVKSWLDRIRDAECYWEETAFKRMREDMEFVTGLQWPGQKTIKTDRYVANLTLRLIGNKVATLYAKDPKAVAKRRPRLDFTIWDGNVDSLAAAAEQAGLFQQAFPGEPLPPQLSSLFADYQTGKQRQKLIDQFCRTLEIIYQYQVDASAPEFKEQFKQMVRRAIICGVGYVRPIFCSAARNYTKVSTIDHSSSFASRVGRVKELVSRLNENGEDPHSPAYSQLRSLILSLGASEALDDDPLPKERIEFDFPEATAIIPDRRCRSLKQFTAARWIAQKYVLPRDEVNAIFGTSIKSGTGADQALEVDPLGQGETFSRTNDDFLAEASLDRHLVNLYEVYDYTTRTKFYVCQGWPDYVSPPEAPSPGVAGFWEHQALTFNDIEAGSGTSPFPPSDVDTIRHIQLEWNRTRDALRAHRNANAPKYLVRKGALTQADKDKLYNAEPNEVIELEGVPADQPLDKFIVPFQFAEIDPKLYDTAPLEADLLYASGVQQANIGPAQPNVTATVGNIAEQSRMNVSASNIDDLDGVLSRLAQAGGEMLMRAMSTETATRIAGPGAVWPMLEASREDFLNEVFLTIEAASSGRPNRAVEVSNFAQITPLLQAAGANPVALVEHGARLLDENADVSKFFPIMLPSQASPETQPGESSPQEEPPAESAQEASPQGGLPDASLAAPTFAT